MYLKENLEQTTVMSSFDKGLFINDVITFGGYRDHPPSPLSSCHLSASPPPFVSVNGEKNRSATKQRTPAQWANLGGEAR